MFHDIEVGCPLPCSDRAIVVASTIHHICSKEHLRQQKCVSGLLLLFLKLRLLRLLSFRLMLLLKLGICLRLRQLIWGLLRSLHLHLMVSTGWPMNLRGALMRLLGCLMLIQYLLRLIWWTNPHWFWLVRCVWRSSWRSRLIPWRWKGCYRMLRILLERVSITRMMHHTYHVLLIVDSWLVVLKLLSSIHLWVYHSSSLLLLMLLLLSHKVWVKSLMNVSPSTQESTLLLFEHLKGYLILLNPLLL